MTSSNMSDLIHQPTYSAKSLMFYRCYLCPVVACPALGFVNLKVVQHIFSPCVIAYCAHDLLLDSLAGLFGLLGPSIVCTFSFFVLDSVCIYVHTVCIIS